MTVRLSVSSLEDIKTLFARARVDDVHFEIIKKRIDEVKGDLRVTACKSRVSSAVDGKRPDMDVFRFDFDEEHVFVVSVGPEGEGEIVFGKLTW